MFENESGVQTFMFTWFSYSIVKLKGVLKNYFSQRRLYVGTGLVPVLTLRRTATRAVPTFIPPQPIPPFPRLFQQPPKLHTPEVIILTF
ncbi:MAG: hypothetical protein AMJ73_07245 [candidate division Zixibacteria bacterium SM1_73]|nr:MAG: hypothetical protein AMJ73_07245 [candidate division Zixibacteria bacterium SM1_73]